MDAPAVSVVVTAYNRAAFLPQAIDSALAQTFADREIVVVDDGSTDGTPEILARYSGRIRAVRQENGGEAAARNRGVREARGTWVAFLDSDDAWEPGALDAAMAFAREHPEAGLVAFRARAMAADGTPLPRTHGKRSPGPFFSTRSLLMGDAGGVLMPVVKRALLLEAGGFDTSLVSATDCDMWLRLSFRTTLAALSDPLLLVRVHPQNLSADKSVNARMWLRILGKLAAERPGWVASNRFAFRRALGKERLRLGRELLAAYGGDPAVLAEARASLASSLAAFPFFARAWLYLLWSLAAPRRYAAWRRLETRRR